MTLTLVDLCRVVVMGAEFHGVRITDDNVVDLIADYTAWSLPVPPTLAEIRAALAEAFRDDFSRATSYDDGDTMSDVEADADTLKSIGWGTDEDYGGGTHEEDFGEW